MTQVTGYEAVRAAARDWAVYSSEYQGQPDVRTYRQYPLEADPPAHGAYRAILTPLFQRGHVTSLEAALRTVAAELVSQFVAAGRAEAVGELALPMVVRSLGHAFGRPRTRASGSPGAATSSTGRTPAAASTRTSTASSTRSSGSPAATSSATSPLRASTADA